MHKTYRKIINSLDIPVIEMSSEDFFAKYAQLVFPDYNWRQFRTVQGSLIQRYYLEEWPKNLPNRFIYLNKNHLLHEKIVILFHEKSHYRNYVKLRKYEGIEGEMRAYLYSLKKALKYQLKQSLIFYVRALKIKSEKKRIDVQEYSLNGYLAMQEVVKTDIWKRCNSWLKKQN
ncbi:hypothetical protein LCGC14_1337110 [marine sediment metagenome]|uniref:Uncharacterized protein n=1 Tax=marine sediment metagenome TaxID=412755 RepID=A0A0F9MVN2_9ZZZZ